MTDRKLISIVVPAYNEEACVEELERRLALVFAANPKYDFEAIIVENGSIDRTWELLQQICEKDNRFKTIQLARNFRMDGGLTAGLNYASGDAVVLMTADLQDPPELKVYEAVRGMEERNRFIRGLFAWVGFKSLGIEAERPERFGGVSNAHSLKVIDLAFKGIFSHSYIPLKLITLCGILLSGVSVFSLVAFALSWVFIGVPFAGFGTIISLVLLVFGFLTFMLGLIAEYIGLIYEEVKQRPNYVVRTDIGFGPNSDSRNR